MLNKITQWLNNPDRIYKEGVDLYLKIRKDKVYDQFFQQADNFPKTDFHYQLLHKEIHSLVKIYHSEIATINPKPIEIRQTPGLTKKVKTADKPVIIDHPEIDFRELPEDLQDLYRENKELYQNQRKKHLELKNPELTDDQRKIIAEEIVSLDSQIRENWKVIDTWYQNRDMPEKKPANSLSDVVKLKDQISNYENYVRRYRSYVADATDDKKREKYQKHLDKYTMKVALLKANLEELTK